MLGKVLITAKSVSGSTEAMKYLTEAGCEVDLKDTPSPVEMQWLRRQVEGVDALIFAMEPVTAELLTSASRLKVIARPGVGYDTIDVAAATKQGIAVTIAPGMNHESVADFAMGLLLILARGILPAATAVQEGRWQRVTGTEVWGKTLLIFGFGRVGQSLARRARGFDMRILAATRQKNDPIATAEGIESVTLEKGLCCADFVSLHAPLTESTDDIINGRTLALMKKSAYLINTARGGLIDELALANAVVGGRLAGAAVDVIRDNAGTHRSPLIGVPGIIVTPHMASFARESMARVALCAAQSVVAVLKGERPYGLLNPAIYGPA